MTKEYLLEVATPRILEMLGPSLYTNIYYVLAELIANAYDADARNVYIILENDCIQVEDDGHGMSYENHEVENYLKVGYESRVADSDSLTKKGNRRKMGRKGLGKLAALSASENVDVLTIANGEKSGFILSRHIGEDRKLKAIPNEEIVFRYIKNHGSAIIMRNPQYRIHKTGDVIKRNILKLFPLVGKDFRIHIILDNKTMVIEDFDKEIIKNLGGLITLGEQFKPLCDLIPKKYADLAEAKDQKIISIDMETKDGDTRKHDLEIFGWIGIYQTTENRKAKMSDFPDNFISLFANGKMGEFNILPLVGKNSLNEVYVVGQLHVDLFELTELPDMALTNRQGYKFDDPRYQSTLDYVRTKLLPDILRKRISYAKIDKESKNNRKEQKKMENEEKLKKAVENFQKKTGKDVASEIKKLELNVPTEKIEKITSVAIEKNKSEFLELKNVVDEQKKKILISHAYKDKVFVDVIYKMLQSNNIPSEDILYTSCDDEECRAPYGVEVYDVLHDFFVKSYSKKAPYVMFVTSENMRASWNAIVEVGASWVTKDPDYHHPIFNIIPFQPEDPLNNRTQWSNAKLDGGLVVMDKLNADIFCIQIEAVCDELGYKKKTREENMKMLSRMISIVSSPLLVNEPPTTKKLSDSDHRRLRKM